jgi:hypothetical protein
MALDKIISISGQPGLYQVISQTKYGLIAEHLEDGKRVPVYSNLKVVSLAEISIYTAEEEVPLNDVMLKLMEIEGGKPVSIKSDNDAKDKFEQVLPTYDRERVYVSDMKKLLKWYNALLKRDLIVKDEEETASEEQPEATAAEETAEKKAPKKAAAKKSATEKKSAAAPKTAAPKAASKSKGAAKVSAPRKAQ